MPKGGGHRAAERAAAAAAASQSEGSVGAAAASAVASAAQAPIRSGSSSSLHSSSPFAMDPVAIAVGVGVGLVFLLIAAYVYIRQRLADKPYEELSLIKSESTYNEQRDGGDSDIEGGSGVVAGSESSGPPPEGPQPLPAPSVLDQVAPPPLPRFSRLELRQLEADGNIAHCWAGLAPRSVPVRAASYLRDGKKAPSEQGSLLLATELFRTSGTSPHVHVAQRASSPVHTLDRRTSAALSSVFVVNMIIPASEGAHYQVVFYFGILAEAGGAADAPVDAASAGASAVASAVASPAAKLYERFCAGTDAFRNARFKLIPSVAEGPQLVKQGVSSRPAILGKTLRLRFFRGTCQADDQPAGSGGGEGGSGGGSSAEDGSGGGGRSLRNGLSYFEVDCDCNSSPSAGRVVSLVKSYARDLVVDLAFVIEAQTAEECPERVLGCVRMLHISLDEDAVPIYQ